MSGHKPVPFIELDQFFSIVIERSNSIPDPAMRAICWVSATYLKSQYLTPGGRRNLDDIRRAWFILRQVTVEYKLMSDWAKSATLTAKLMIFLRSDPTPSKASDLSGTGKPRSDDFLFTKEGRDQREKHAVGKLRAAQKPPLGKI